MASDENDTGEKTQAPTGRRVGQARSDGMVGKSVELSQLVGMTAAFIALQQLAPRFWKDMQVILTSGFTSRYFSEPMTTHTMRSSFYSILLIVGPEVLAMMSIAAIFGAGCTLLQTKFLWSNKLLRPKFTQLNPINGIKRLFSVMHFVQFLKAVAKLTIIGPVAYFAFIELLPQLMHTMDVPLFDVLPITSAAMDHVFWAIVKWLAILALADFSWQKWQNYKNLKMTVVETKDERKSVEGDEQTKNTIRTKGFERIRRRMLQAVPKADVIITNPTHLSVALQYSFERGSAPKVVAKGRGHMALRIREIAKQHGVPIVERKPLARALFKSVEVGQQIPYELYQAVAEIFAYLFRIKGRRPVITPARDQSKGASR